MRSYNQLSTRLLALALAALFFLLQLTHALPVTTSDLTPVHPENALTRRGCIPSKPSKPASNPPKTNTYTFSMDTLNQAISSQSTYPLDSNTCLFYLGLGGATGQTLAQDWWTQNKPASAASQMSIVWGNVLEQYYHSAMLSANLVETLPDPANPAQQINAQTVWASLLSQAMGESCTGTVYFFTPEANDGTNPVTNVWNVYEYPALTRNSKVQQIIKVDPNTNKQEVMWTKGDAVYGPVPPGTGYSQVKTLAKAEYPTLR
ncbi:uncharacterized protein BO72DRAFT_33895 [Aspergillus fijiensis CBS 313.89]|uniref:Uncharacterized protein n=1 Tax=Aspergillus fijiensis CBS 313.89 TaxID=1448319 RepID=A0A8G1W1G0_9EURO|nr:uncharacterized protein BO72DRAFT_33895 [Aspergillus fijiensis CBS 313.89]RAK79653.1 hypothetical protein BO72DRAFT_33895 [Aspergillus fijiensis CBS 313.89]